MMSKTAKSRLVLRELPEGGESQKIISEKGGMVVEFINYADGTVGMCVDGKILCYIAGQGISDVAGFFGNAERDMWWGFFDQLFKEVCGGLKFPILKRLDIIEDFLKVNHPIDGEKSE